MVFGQPTVLYEDADLLVINKPAGLIVNRSDTSTHEETLQDFVEKYLHLPANPYTKRIQQEGEYPTAEQVFQDRSGIVHRLDKETSGIILVAKNPHVFTELQRQFKERLVHKTYQALAHGKITPEEGEINVPVGRLEYNRMRFGVVAGGRESCTLYKTIKNYELKTKNNNEFFTLVELYPKTGRTHQIRVHLKHINHPIFGDELYAGRKTARNDRNLLARVFLHAAAITFLHPTTHKEMHFEAPLTEELEQTLNALQKQ